MSFPAEEEDYDFGVEKIGYNPRINQSMATSDEFKSFRESRIDVRSERDGP